MNCKICGSPIEDETKFCSNCGSPVEEAVPDIAETPAPEPVIPEEAVPSLEPEEPVSAPEPDAAPTQPTGAPVPPEQPAFSGTQPQSTPVSPNPYASQQIPPYDPTMNPIPPMGAAAPPKKKKHIGLIILLCLIPVIIVAVIIIAVICYGVSVGKQGGEAVEEYWTAYVNCDAEELADMVPDAYWTYISDTYDVTEEEAIIGMQLYLEETEEALGGNLTYEWKSTAVQFGSGSSSELDEPKEVVGEYGLDFTKGIGVSMEATISGDTDSEDYDFALWIVKIDDEWYNVSAMTDFDDVCSAGYADAGKYVAAYGDIVDSYWNGFVAADGAALANLVPENFWDFIGELYDCTQEEAEQYLSQYLTENMSQSYPDLSKLTINAEITDAYEMEADEVQDLNDGLEEYGLAGDAMTDVYTDLELLYDGEKTEDSTYVTLTQVGDTWYVYDVMYYFADACATYADSVSFQ